jgi:hypothetical protein
MTGCLATVQSQKSALSLHDERSAFLRDLATLIGCRGQVDVLPDGHRPDVLRYNIERGLLFVGDAKDTETPGCAATRERLRYYVSWVSAHVSSGGRGLVVICFGEVAHGAGWSSVLQALSQECGLHCIDQGVRVFGRDLLVAWVLLCARPAPD